MVHAIKQVHHEANPLGAGEQLGLTGLLGLAGATWGLATSKYHG